MTLLSAGCYLGPFCGDGIIGGHNLGNYGDWE